MSEVLPLTQYSWCHLQHCGKIMAAAFCFCGVAVWPKQTVPLQKSSLWRAKHVLALHLLCALWGYFQIVSLSPSKHGTPLLRLQGNVESQAVRVEGEAKEEVGDAKAVLAQSQAEEGDAHRASLLFLLPLHYYLFFLNLNHQLQVDVLAMQLNWWWNVVFLGRSLADLQHTYKARCPESRHALSLGKDFHVHSRRPVLISVLLASLPSEQRVGSSCLLQLHLFEPPLFLQWDLGESVTFLSWGNLACPSGEGASVGWLDALLFHKDINNIQGVTHEWQIWLCWIFM